MRRSSEIPFITEADIEMFAHEVREKAYVVGVATSFPFDAESTIEQVFEGYSLVLGGDLPPMVLGSTSWQTKEVRISQEVLSHPGRTRFTVAHEIGHIVLHVPILAARQDRIKLFDFDDSIQGDERMEIQADMFAAALLMPKLVFLERFGSMANQDNSIDPRMVAEMFGVSNEAASNRLERLGLVRKTSPGQRL